MQIDKKALERLLSLDDETLKKTISALAASAGLGQKAVESVTADLGKVRTSLSKASDADIASAVNMLGNERTAEIMKKLKSDQNGK